MTARFERLHSGVFECEECGARYEVENWPEDDLFCNDSCSGELVLADDGLNDDDDDDDEEVADSEEVEVA